MGYGSATLGVAIVWAAVIMGCAVVLKDSGYFSQLIPILGGGAAASIIVVNGGCKGKSGEMSSQMNNKE